MTVNIEQFQCLIKLLRKNGFCNDADKLEAFFNAAWTTSSELIGELGLQLLRIKRDARLPDDVSIMLEHCVSEVKKVWPKIKL